MIDSFYKMLFKGSEKSAAKKHILSRGEKNLSPQGLRVKSELPRVRIELMILRGLSKTKVLCDHSYYFFALSVFSLASWWMKITKI